MIVPLFVGREKSIEALEIAMKDKKQVFLVTQKEAKEENPKQNNLYQIGTIATVLQLLKLPDGTVKVLVEGSARASIAQIITHSNYAAAEVSIFNESDVSLAESEVLARTLLSQFDQYAKLNKKISTETISSLDKIDDDLDRLVDTMASHLLLKISQKQSILDAFDLTSRIECVLALLDNEIELLTIEKRIRGRVKNQMERSQREYYLNEQMKAIQKELDDGESNVNELDELKNKIETAGMTAEGQKKALAELNKLKLMSPMSAEASVIRSYIECIVNVPWRAQTKARLDLAKAKLILENDHYGLDEVKERILEYLAVQKRVKKIKGPILCLVGPPGVGKTSLAESIAKATNRKFARMALGGVHDDAEIRGHRRTYIGSMPGRIIQRITKVGVKNPLFLLDEIDKMGQDMRGDPASALLEVLDPEQNNHFNDHYLEIDYDLSNVMFICTANSMNIPAPLLDRMEIIRLPGYTEDEKNNIAERYLLPKQIKENGLKNNELSVDSDVVSSIIRSYTREAGVRNLERQLAKLCRKVIKEHSDKKEFKVNVNTVMLENYLGVPKYHHSSAEKDNQIGQVTGLAWTEVGGELLTIEATVVPGKGHLIKTGSLGDVMLESITAAQTVVRGRANKLGIKADFYEKCDIHIHVPEGATPKDGPSAGIGMCTAMVSALTNKPVKANVAMTGEITLRGQVLAIGGLKEKLLAAHRERIRTVIIPKDNVRDLKDIPDNIKEILDIKPVKWIEEVLEIALA
ncbi:UNVERIFIED_CONTAM: hypothetical protein GTU68_040907 [Idotea baltica]|nr:hypothetical protein [Idotea baltica]